MPEAKTFTGGCHCGRVRFETAVDLANVISCNCSICQKRGLLLTFMPAAEFKLQSGEDAQTDYRFNKNQIAHAFCTTCGIESFARGRMPSGAEMVGINVRCLDDVDLAALKPKAVDGKSF
jgi:hypothetical protein